MFIGSPYNLKHKISDYHILISNIPIARIDKFSCLGVNMDEQLSRRSHIDNICSKVGAGLGLIREIKPFVPLSTLKMLYNAIVLPYFEYCSTLLDNSWNTKKIQSRAARISARDALIKVPLFFGIIYHTRLRLHQPYGLLRN